MAHKRQSIRDALVTILSDGMPGVNVYANRQTSLWKAELPAVLVYTLDEAAEPRDVRSTQFIRSLQVIVEIKVAANANSDTVMDNYAEQVETLIRADQSISGNALAAIYKSTETRLDSESQDDIATGTLTFECKYIY